MGRAQKRKEKEKKKRSRKENSKRALPTPQRPAPNSLEHRQAAILPQDRRKRRRSGLADAVGAKTAVVNVNGGEVRESQTERIMLSDRAG